MPRPGYIFRFLRMREPVDAGILKVRDRTKKEPSFRPVFAGGGGMDIRGYT